MQPLLSAATLWCLLSVSSALVAPRDSPVCARKDIVFIDKLLKAVPTPASRFCSSFLHISTPLPATVTVTQQSTATSTGFTTVVVATTSTTTEVVLETQTATTTLSIPGITTTTTRTTTSYSAPPVIRKRALLDERADPPTPAPLIGVAKTVASAACSCFLGLPRPTTTVVSATTVPTTIATSTTTLSALTLTTTSTAVTTSTSTTTGPPVSTATAVSVVPINYSYDTVVGSTRGCTYNRYYDFPAASNDPGPAGNYKDAVNACETTCTNDPRCKFFLYLRFDPAEARGYDGAACIFDDQPYDAALLQCSYPTQFVVAYNRVPA